MGLRHAVAASMLVLSGFLPAQAQQGQGIPGLHVKPVEVVDRTGFDRPLTAYTLMVPHHWQVTGGVVWNVGGGCNTSGYNFDWRAAAPDDSEGVALLPVVQWQSQPGGPCPQMSVRNAYDFLAAVTQQILPNAQILDYRQRPDLMQELQAMVSRQDYGSFVSEQTVDAGEVLIGYTENGREFRASMMVQLLMWRMTTPAMYGMPGIDMAGGMSLPGFVAAAPAGRLDLRVAEAIRKSIAPGPEWSQRIAQHHRVLNRQNAQHASRQSQITSQTYSEISDMIHQGYRDRDAIRDRGQRETTESIRGVETYNDPINGGTVQLDNTYNHAWQLNDGSYVLTNDPNFTPGVSLGLDGRLLQVTP